MKPRSTIKKLIEKVETDLWGSGGPHEPVTEGRAQDRAFRKFLRMTLGAMEDEVLENFWKASGLEKAVEKFAVAEAIAADLYDEERRK